ncbi:hypothetical protein J4437_04550 [Candidatus Woesearchaeota archaeon]|nr:hypothetical protein [Candidatus Woesearchaeota archaeon]
MVLNDLMNSARNYGLAAGLGLAALASGCAATNTQAIGGEQVTYSNHWQLMDAANKVLKLEPNFLKTIKVNDTTYVMGPGTQAIVYQLAGLCDGQGEIAVEMNSDGTGKFYASMTMDNSFDASNPTAQKVTFWIDSVQCANGCTPGDQILKGPQETNAFVKDLLINPAKYSSCIPKVRLVEFVN